MKVWIDLGNSPSALLFAPISRRLESLGHEVVVTARDNAQTKDLALQRWPSVEIIGGPSPQGRWPKVAATAQRIGALSRFARSAGPDVALSHNSYAQIVAARASRVPVITAMDFEHQPANHAAFRLAHKVLLPEALRGSNVRRMGATPRKTDFYPGLKEEVYLGDFEPDGEVLAKIGIERLPGSLVAVARTPPSRAIYHQFGNPLFIEVLHVLAAQPSVVCVALARYPEQREMLEALRLPNLVVPKAAIDSRSLICAADVVIGAGGTMTREAALLGARTFSVFTGRSPAVDRYLERQGRLVQLRSAADLASLCASETVRCDLGDLRRRGSSLVEVFVQATLATATRS